MNTLEEILTHTRRELAEMEALERYARGERDAADPIQDIASDEVRKP